MRIIPRRPAKPNKPPATHEQDFATLRVANEHLVSPVRADPAVRAEMIRQASEIVTLTDPLREGERYGAWAVTQGGETLTTAVEATADGGTKITRVTLSLQHEADAIADQHEAEPGDATRATPHTNVLDQRTYVISSGPGLANGPSSSPTALTASGADIKVVTQYTRCNTDGVPSLLEDTIRTWAGPDGTYVGGNRYISHFVAPEPPWYPEAYGQPTASATGEHVQQSLEAVGLNSLGDTTRLLKELLEDRAALQAPEPSSTE